ncbi:MAG TPA: MBL fold metallo-hydrolase [Candidatus Angelobacter sp.]|nr:MBL fold metallo-hydrolase [Candidatus Angelobacter sp.]
MRLQLVRHATLLLDYAGMRILVDPMLSDAGAMAAIQNSPQPRPNPLVGLPLPVEQVLDGVQLVLVTHTHRDHWDDAAIQLVPKDLPLLCQPEDLKKMEAVHFVNASAVHDVRYWSHVCITRTPAQHGTGEIARAMAPSSGYVLSSAGEPTLYIAGDTIWYDQVAETIKEHNPQVIVANAGAAQFLHGDPITMTAGDVVRVCRAAPQAQVVAVHMEAINHCLLTRAALAREAGQAGVRVEIPDDGGAVDFQ